MKLYGKNPVIERLRNNPKSIRKISFVQGFSDSSLIRKKAKQHGIPIYVMPKSKMLKVGRGINTQGIMVDVEDFQYADFDEMLERAVAKKRCLVFLDELNDPQNLGAIIRSLACLGKFSLVIPTHKSVSVTEAVLRIASGGENFVPISKVSNTNNAIKKAKQMGFMVAGAVVKAHQRLDRCELSGRLALVVGSEHKGIRDVVRKNLDVEFAIPMAVDTLSFNVAHAASIICYEITRQKKKNKE